MLKFILTIIIVLINIMKRKKKNIFISLNLIGLQFLITPLNTMIIFTFLASSQTYVSIYLMLDNLLFIGKLHGTRQLLEKNQLTL